MILTVTCNQRDVVVMYANGRVLRLNKDILTKVSSKLLTNSNGVGFWPPQVVQKTAEPLSADILKSGQLFLGPQGVCI